MATLDDETWRLRVAALSDGQRLCLELVNQHLTSKEIAHRLDISKHTVDQRLKLATVALGVARRLFPKIDVEVKVAEWARSACRAGRGRGMSEISTICPIARTRQNKPPRGPAERWTPGVPDENRAFSRLPPIQD